MPYGDSSLYLASGVSFLNEEKAVFDAMLDGWAMQQIGGRNLRKASLQTNRGEPVMRSLTMGNAAKETV